MAKHLHSIYNNAVLYFIFKAFYKKNNNLDCKGEFVMFKKFALLALTGCLIQFPAHAAPLLNPDSVAPQKRIADANSWVEIDEQAFTRNLEKLKKTVIPKSKVCAIIKADAFGHGIDLLMPAIMRSNVSCIGVTGNEEARLVRQSGYKGTLIRVRTAVPAEVRNALQYNIEEMVGGLEYARELSAIAKSAKRPIKVHLVLNAKGLSRNGLETSTEQGKKEAVAITKLDGIKITGIMTHYPVEGEQDVKKSLAIFLKEADWLIKTAKLKRNDILLHTSNTYATIFVPDTRLDAVRVAAALFGYGAPGYEEVMTFKTKVASVNKYPKGNSVGYDRTFVLKRDSRLANLPIGYSDGYVRNFGNKGHVIINGHRVPVVGTISMNTTMVDVTDYPDIKAGDEVVLYGRQGSERVTQEEVEKGMGTMLLELYSIWGNSNPKILKK